MKKISIRFHENSTSAFALFMQALKNFITKLFSSVLTRRSMSLGCAVMFLCSFLLSACSEFTLTNPTPTTPPAGLVINEILSSNHSCLVASDSTTPDWIELYNNSDADINLEGYGLTDKAKEPFLFTFPSVTIAAKGYLVVYCTDSLDISNKDGILRTGFKLSSSGETLALTGANKVTIQVMEFPAIPTDVSYGLAENGEYLFYEVPTPAAPNSGTTSETGEFGDTKVDSSLIINEYMTSNKYSIPDSDGERCDWVEIKNTGSNPVNLHGYGLSDSEDDPRKWSFPDKELGAGEVQIVFLSGKNKVTSNGELHASFRLSTSDPQLMLLDEHGKIVDSVTPEDLNGSVSKGRNVDQPDAWLYYPVSTPGTDNTLKGFDNLADAENALPDVYISEVKSINPDHSADWIELYNSSSKSVDLTGYGLSDNNENLYRFKFDDVKINAGEYKIIECVGTTGTAGKLKAPFGLSVSDETVYLTDTEGRIIDHIDSGVQSGTISVGRSAGSNKQMYFAASTKGKANDGTTYATYAKTPDFSVAGGYASSGTKVELSAGKGETIYYTLNGAEPTQNSQKYTAPITITKTTPIRAKSFGENKAPSLVSTQTYIVGVSHEVPIVCINMDPDDFSSDAKGIYAKGPGYSQEDGDGSDYAHTKANYWQNWERKMNFEFFEADGTEGVDFDAGIKIFGQYSRELAQKSFSIHLRGQYGLAEVTYPFFRDFDITTFSTLILRTSGQDWNLTKFKDAFIHQITKGTMDMDYMEYRPCVVYINGEYWGIYNIREKENESYVESHYKDAKEGQIDIIKGNTNVKAGSNKDWEELRAYIKSKTPCFNGGTNLLNDKTVMAYIEERVDMKDFMEWAITEIFCCNTDTGNMRVFRYQGGKWRYMLFDLDWGFQTDGYKKNGDKTFIEDFFNPNGAGSGDRFYTHMQMAVYYNNTWREQFIELYAKHMKTTFAPERLTAIIDKMAAEIRPEMGRNIQKWNQPASMNKWEDNVKDLKDTVTKRWDAAKQEFQSFFKLSDARMSELFS